MSSEVDVERAQDLDRRLRAYEELQSGPRWPGALTTTDCVALAVLALALVVGFYLWGGQP
ncbi:hypothetical protein D3C76_1717610 [compost metagenome]|uniref:hypothetical protein n=1 Tax=Pseudomonas sp. GM84 TaxID=1144340 RepID=UPI00026F794B|nr:hypothetical protein [Pseudomonas sp. GM84]EJN37797.1 hypothetical protein PMI38_02720 [Pseudomonas sp. GM84]